MTSKKLFFGMLATTGLLVLGVAAAMFGSLSILAKQSDSLVDLKLQNRVLEEQQTSLIQAKKAIEKYTPLDQIARKVVPQDKDQAKAVRDISSLASSSGIKLSGISFPASSLGQKNTTAPGSSKTPTNVTQVTPVNGIPGVYVMEITVQQDTAAPITYDKLLEFLGKLETNRRTAQVTNVTVQPNAKDRRLLTFNLILNAYIRP